jgi:anti-anti-sigma factor
VDEPFFRCEVDQAGDQVVVRAIGELDMVAAPELSGCLRELHEAGVRRFVLDLRETTFMDSSGLRLTLDWHGELSRDSGTLRIVRGPPAVQRVFEITGLGDQLEFVDSAGRE